MHIYLFRSPMITFWTVTEAERFIRDGTQDALSAFTEWQRKERLRAVHSGRSSLRCAIKASKIAFERFYL